VRAAAGEFNRVGYFGTDSNRLARAAGYAPATFYKHFADKRAIFLAAYAAWVSDEWAEVDRLVQRGGPPPQVAAAVVDTVLDLHRRWRGLRASLRALVATDAHARKFYRAQRRGQLQRLAGQRRGRASGAAADDAILLFTLERVCDAIADGELSGLGVPVAPTVARLREALIAYITRTRAEGVGLGRRERRVRARRSRPTGPSVAVPPSGPAGRRTSRRSARRTSDSTRRR
jgi:AcrR family transcriptional regulator